jgi:DUF4097 and DUF4098 domain-containing protein YvlB
MHRSVYVAVGLVVAGGAVVNAAAAKQVVPLHSAEVTKALPAAFRSVSITVDEGAVRLHVGNRHVMHVHEGWNFHQPTVDVHVSHEQLDVSVSCAAQQWVGPVEVDGATDPANDCVDDVDITLPASVPVQVQAPWGPITSTGARGGLSLVSGLGDVTVTDAAGPQILLSSDSGAIHLSDARAHVVALNGDVGDIVASTLKADSLTAQSSSGAVSVQQLDCVVAAIGSDSGDVHLSNAVATSKLSVSASNGAVSVQHLVAGEAALASDAGDITLSDAAIRSVATLRSSNGAVTATRVRADWLRTSTDAGDIHGAALDLVRLSGHTSQGATAYSEISARHVDVTSGSGDLQLALRQAPDWVSATSTQGSVTVAVPAGRYDVIADSSDGAVHVSGVTVDRHSRRIIRAHSDTADVTVAGQ